MKRNSAFKLGLLLFLIPFIIGMIFYSQMPNQMPIHFGFNNEADNYASKEFALFGLPSFLLLIYFIAYKITSLDPKRKNQGDKAFNIVLFFVPILSIITSSLAISYAKGQKPDIGLIMTLSICLMFILLGNYMPKIKRNYSLGIKLPWTMDNDFIWDKTHRFAGKVYMVCGFLGIIIAILFKNMEFLFAINIFVMVILPTIYSYLLYKNLRQDNEK